MRTTFKDIVCIERSVHAAICKTKLWVSWEKCSFHWLVYSVFYTLFTLEMQYCFKKILFSLQTDTVRYWYAGQKSVLRHLLRKHDFFQKDAVLLSHRQYTFQSQAVFLFLRSAFFCSRINYDFDGIVFHWKRSSLLCSQPFMYI